MEQHARPYFDRELVKQNRAQREQEVVRGCSSLRQLLTALGFGRCVVCRPSDDTMRRLAYGVRDGYI